MRVISTLLLFCCVSSFSLTAQDIQYATGRWEREGLGNHRAVIWVDGSADAVRVHIPWRRRDAQPEKKELILIDAATGRRVSNIFKATVSAEYGDIIFQPVTGKGSYYLYYLPSKNTGNSWLPTVMYQPATNSCDQEWLIKNGLSANVKSILDVAAMPEATVLRFESVSDEHSFFPMEVPATAQETKDLIARHRGKDFLVFTEDRKFPIRMTDALPYRWIKEGVLNSFSGMAMRNEFYVFQLGIFAITKNITHVQLKFSGLKDARGNEIPSGAMRCFNMGGKDWLGKSFTKKVSVLKNNIQPLWIGIDMPATVVPGEYTGTIDVSDGKYAAESVTVHITINSEIIANRGYDDLVRLARLNWLDSDIGLNDSVFKPYTPVTIKGQTINILGRSLTFDRTGFPAAITSTFSADNTTTNGSPKKILGSAIQFNILANGKEIQWKRKKQVITEREAGAVSWKTQQTSDVADMEVLAKMECDGYVNYYITVNAKRDMNFDDIRLMVPYAKSTATYMMGMGKKGGVRPAKWEWKWEVDKANNMIWMGDANAGMQCKLKHEVADWKLYGFDETGPYKDWSNDGLGGCLIEERGDDVVMQAFTGAKTVTAGQKLHFNFGLLITPLKPLDNSHWNQRYFQTDNLPVDKWMTAVEKGGANIINIHQGNKLNPYINYPFAATPPLKSFIEQARHKGVRSKLYYTVRELSVTNTPELWPLLSFGNEIFTRGYGIQLADQFSDKPDISNEPTGAAWLTEHLIKGYDPAWHNALDNGEMDISIRTTGLSRWHNYYLEGLSWLVKHTGMKGLYLDGVGYDREIMKRVRKVMDNAADSCLIDFHSGNNFEIPYGLNSPANQYMELFTAVNSLWLGEGYQYDKEADDYWFVEISGIPLGLYGEMLQHCGNFYKGMIYGMSSRLGWGGCNPAAVWKFWDEVGIQKSVMKGYWNKENPVTISNTWIKETTYQQEQEAIIVLANWSADEQVADLLIDWDKLHMNKSNVKITVPSIAGYQEGRTISSLENIKIVAGQGLIISVKKQ